MNSRSAVCAIIGLLLSLTSGWAQSCPKEPPFPNTNDINEVIAACKKYGGTWHGDQYGGCTFPADWCKKSQSDNISMPLPQNQQEFATELFAVAATAWFNGFANKLKTDQQRAEQARVQQLQLAAQRRQQQLRQRQQVIDRLTGNGKNDDLQLVFDDSSLGVNRKAGEVEGKPGELKLVFDDSTLGVKRESQVAESGSGYGINGLPGIYTGGAADGDGSSGGYGIPGLPGVYTNGADPNGKSTFVNNAHIAQSVKGLPGLYLNNDHEMPVRATPATASTSSGGYGISGLPGTYTGGAGESGTRLSAGSNDSERNSVPPQSPQQMQVSQAPAESSPASPPSTAIVPKSGGALQQLQHTADQSQRAATAETDEEAAHRASQPFDNGNRTPVVDLRGTKMPSRAGGRLGDSTAAVTPPPLPSTQTPSVLPATNRNSEKPAGSWTRPLLAVQVPPNPDDPFTEAAARSDREMSIEAKWTDDEFVAVKKSGIVDRHAEKICDYVQKACKGTIIMQNVNAGAAKWINTGMATPKPARLKVKTATGGDTPGLIPCRANESGDIVGIFQTADPKKVVQEECPECQCVEAVPGKRVLADAHGFFFVSDYDPYVIHCEGDDGQVTDGEYGLATEKQRTNIRELNKVLTFPIQHGAGFDYDGVVKLPATVFEYDEDGDRCRIRSLNTEAAVREYIRKMGLSGKPVTGISVR
jgi:hypothetical protein